MHKEINWGRDLSAVFPSGIFLTVIKIFLLPLAENIHVGPRYLSKTSSANLLIGQIFLLIHFDYMKSLLFGNISHEYLCLISLSIQFQEDIGWLWCGPVLPFVGFLHKAPPCPNLSPSHTDMYNSIKMSHKESFTHTHHWQLFTWYVFRGNEITWMLTIFMPLLALY